MTDPLEAISDNVLRTQLEELRELDGAILTSEQLRQTVPGFRGQKGIYKPRGSPYALWVRQTLRRVYPDKELVPSPDGSWMYYYSPEGRGGRPQMSLDTNRALLQCMTDRVPVGVIRQLPSVHGKRTYEVRGLGYVTEFDGMHFKIRGEPIDVADRPAITSGHKEFEPFDRTFTSQRRLSAVFGTPDSNLRSEEFTTNAAASVTSVTTSGRRRSHSRRHI